jgi:hypothetical protein
MKTLIKIVLIFVAFPAIVYYYFFYIDLASGCTISITPSILELSNLNIKRAIGVLKYASPTDYQNLCAHIGNINPNFSCGGLGGGCFWMSDLEKDPRSIDVSTTKDDLAWTVSVITHETCHAMQYQEGRPLSEEECHLVGDRVLRSIVAL